MTHRDRIRTKVGAVKTETQSLLKRLRAERLEKARQRRPAALHVVSPAAAASGSQDPGHSDFAAGPGVDRFFAHAPAQPHTAMSEPPPPPSAAVAERPAKAPVARPAQLCEGQRIGLEPLVVRGTEGRRQAEPRLMPIDDHGNVQRASARPPLLNTDLPKAVSRPERPPQPSAPPSAAAPGIRRRNIDPGLLGLKPVFGGSVSLSVPMPTKAPTPVAAPQPAAPPAAKEPRAERGEFSGPASLALSTLAAIGPGLAWKLQNLGILTLDDLVRADPATLRDRLGPLGALVSLDAWIEEARQLLASRKA